MVTMKANRRGTYGTRHLEAHESFEVSPAYGRMWKLSGRAEYVNPEDDDTSRVTRRPVETRRMGASPQTRSADPLPQEQPQESAEDSSSDEELDRDEMRDLRVEYERVLGKRPFPGWDADELRLRMREHQSESEDSGNSEE